MENKNHQIDEYKLGTMFFLNIKSRGEQTTEEYVELFRKIKDNLNLEVPYSDKRLISLKYVHEIDSEDENGNPNLFYGKIVRYDHIEDGGFFDRSTKEETDLNIDPTVAANLRQAVFYFSPQVHRMALCLGQTGVTIKHAYEYFTSIITTLAKDQFDVTVELSHDIMDKVRSAESVLKISTEFTFSNKDFTNGFKELYDKKNKESGAERITLDMKAPKGGSLNMEEDGMADTISSISLSNSRKLEIVIVEPGSKSRTTLKSEDHPRKEKLKKISDNVLVDMIHYLVDLFK